MPAVDSFATLDRVVAKYRRDVHKLSQAAPTDAVTSLEGHLGRTLPRGLRSFLTRHNGCVLFRGALRIRSAAELTTASQDAPHVVLFADGQETRWAWASDGHGGFAFGVWDGAQLVPMHRSFAGWLAGTVAVLESRVPRVDDQEALRFAADQDDVYQLIAAGERALYAGNPKEAEDWLRRATARSGGVPVLQVAAWQRLGDALAVRDRGAARRAWLQALKAARFPLPWRGAPCLDVEILRPLSAAFNQPEEWQRELSRFLDENVSDVRSEQEADVVVAAATMLARSQVATGHRAQACDTLSGLLGRCRTFTHAAAPWHVDLHLARLRLDLGHADEAEKLVRRVRREGPRDLQGPALLLLARIAVTRQEPWAEEILHEALDAGLDEIDGARVACLMVERAVRMENPAAAVAHLERARAAARRVASRPLHARVCLAEGDTCRASGDAAAARDAYERGLVHLSDHHDTELALRLQVRLADLELDAGQTQVASARYRSAAEGYAELQLPVREAWALLRLARTVPAPRHEQLVTMARDRFMQADLAAGVAAADAIAGDPGRSLDWHLDRSTAHARARYDAQRSRPPSTRPDAERPERRLGAHRLAIAACGDGVVTALAREMDSSARAMGSGRNRALDPPVLRYVAAVDLLSGHRSYRAAEILLDHLLSQRTEGHARRALQGAIARSPNAALVDGLLRCIEDPTVHPSQAVAEAAETLGLRREATAVPPLVHLASRRANPIARKAALTALGRIGDRRVGDHLLTALDEPSLAERAALALLMLGDRRGVDFHARALTEGRRDLSGSPGEIVGRYGGPSHLLLLITAADGDDDRALGALQGLGLMGDPRAVPTLLKAIEHRDRQVVAVAAGALQILTGHAEEMDLPGSRSRWNVWWERNQPGLHQGVRYREGRVFDAGLLLDRMDDADAWTRRTAYDELVITTGCQLPFDSDGPWRLQRAHLDAWHQWWDAHRAKQPSGRWFLDGRQIS